MILIAIVFMHVTELNVNLHTLCFFPSLLGKGDEPPRESLGLIRVSVFRRGGCGVLIDGLFSL